MRSTPACCCFTVALTIVTGTVVRARCRRCTRSRRQRQRGSRRNQRPHVGRTPRRPQQGRARRDRRSPRPWCCSIGAGLLLLRSFSSLSRVDTGIRTANLLTSTSSCPASARSSSRCSGRSMTTCCSGSRHCPEWPMRGAAVTLPIGGDAFAAPVRDRGNAGGAPGSRNRAQDSRSSRRDTSERLAFVCCPAATSRRVTRQRAGGRDGQRDVRPAALAWPRIPIGRRMRVDGGAGDWMTVVGLVSDVRHLGPATPPRPEFYRPHSQLSFSFMAFVVRTQRCAGSHGAGDPRRDR